MNFDVSSEWVNEGDALRRSVTFVLSTHSAGKVTDLDFQLAHEIDALIASQN